MVSRKKNILLVFTRKANFYRKTMLMIYFSKLNVNMETFWELHHQFPTDGHFDTYFKHN
jgi:hypothetical protein